MTELLTGAFLALVQAARRVGPHHPTLPLKLGTRASPLALTQTRAFLALLTRSCPALHDVLHDAPLFQELAIRTTGDASQASGQRLADLGGKGLFAKEIHEALLDGRVDMAVHSLKDLETELPPGIVLACTMRREDPSDVLILGPDADVSNAAGLAYPSLPMGALIGSSSVRRQAQLMHARPDLVVQTIRGNVHSRLDKVRRGDFTASLLAMSGLNRLGLADEADVVIDPSVMVPAACQGIVGITVRERDTELRRLLAAISDADSDDAAAAERALQAACDGSCATPIGAYARLQGDRMVLTGLVARGDGSFVLKRSVECSRADGARAGAALGSELRRDAPSDIFV